MIALLAVFLVVGQMLYNWALRQVDQSETKLGAGCAWLGGSALIVLLGAATIGAAALILGGMR